MHVQPGSRGHFLSVLVLGFAITLASSTSALAATHWVNDDDPNGGLYIPPGANCNNPGYATIQSAVTVAVPGDRINVCPGTYLEQVRIPAGKNNIELRSVVHWQAIIKAPPVMIPDPVAIPAFTIVRISGAQNVTILAFTITGPGPGPCASLHFGIRVDSGGSANILGNHITDIRDLPPPPTVSGCQNGVAVLVGRWADGTTGSARIIGNVIERYQKNGPTIDNAGSFAEIAHNRIFGVGPTATIAQNGIQVSRGAAADIEHNFVAGHIYIPQTVVSTGVLLFEPGDVLAEHNSLSANDVGLDTFEPAGSMVASYNLVRASTFDGIALFPATQSQVLRNKAGENGGPGIGVYDSSLNAVDNNVVKDNADSGILIDNSSDNVVGHNELMKNGSDNGDLTDGIRVDSNSANNTIRNNQLRNNNAHDCHDDSNGAGTSATANFWLDNHGGTENRPGLCSGGAPTMSLDATSTFGWNPNYPWYDLFGIGADYDWATAYAGVDTTTLLQLLPAVRLDNKGRNPVSPHP